MTDELEELAGAEMATDTAESVSEPDDLNSDIDPEDSDSEAAEDVEVDASGAEAEVSAASESTETGAEGESKQPPSQGEMPFAIVDGKEMTTLPKDLYIPPDALEVILEAFEGPLDLLLYLIRRQNIDILDINVAEITSQYMQYVEMMNAMQFELAAEYLLMAAMLAEIKSRMLLPRSNEVEDEEEDPRANLIRRLQEYERFKKAAEDIDELPRMGRDIHQGSAQPPDRNLTRPEPEVDLKEVLLALSEVLRRADMFESHHVEKERLSTRERMGQVLDDLSHNQFVPFVSLFKVEEGRLGVVVTFLAVMELIKESLVEIIQSDAFGAIHVKARAQLAQ
ncbi:segregation and condensation protein A [Pseudoteredinibacter isoporae]|uniref:Segregation and condensation protein A n=1 Tax=Pseudoteredinibacter isoporae TaxID=570281 RepID=A0A7X0MX29_9GAMM|nr:segregation and condensation protein A [Pseudoteredinibacter isoporae]